jgi:hypothetical protein
MRRLVLALSFLASALPASAQIRRIAAGYQFTGGSSGYTAQEGRVDGSGLVTDWLGLYAGGSVLTDKVYDRVWSGALGLEIPVGDEDRFRIGGHGETGAFVGQSGSPLNASGVEAGYITQLGPLDTLGIFYRYTSGTLIPVSAIRSSMLFPGAPVVAGLRDTTIRNEIRNGQTFQVNEVTTSGSFDLGEKGKEGAFLDLAVSGIDVSNIGPAVAESAAVSFPIGGFLSAYAAGTLEQSSTLGSLQFGSLGVYCYFGGTP